MSSRPASQGLHHVAYACRDIEETHRFYEELMGFELVHTEVETFEDGGYFRHTFYDLGDGNCIAFFDVHGVGEKEGWNSAVSEGNGLPVWVNHIAFRADEDQQEAVREPHDRRRDQTADGARPRVVPLALLRRPERDHGRDVPRHARVHAGPRRGAPAVQRHGAVQRRASRG